MHIRTREQFVSLSQPRTTFRDHVKVRQRIFLYPTCFPSSSSNDTSSRPGIQLNGYRRFPHIFTIPASFLRGHAFIGVTRRLKFPEKSFPIAPTPRCRALTSFPGYTGAVSRYFGIYGRDLCSNLVGYDSSNAAAICG